MSACPTTTERFQAFQAAHGPITGPLKDRILGTMFDRAIFNYFEYPQSTTLAAFVASSLKHQAPDILAVLELAADWSADPMLAAERQLRAELDAKLEAENESRRLQDAAALKAAIQAKADAFAATLTAEAATVALPARKG